jgi:hypothetical protein
MQDQATWFHAAWEYGRAAIQLGVCGPGHVRHHALLAFGARTQTCAALVAGPNPWPPPPPYTHMHTHQTHALFPRATTHPPTPCPPPCAGEKMPRSQEDWEAEFAKYRASPEFRLAHSHMTLEDFKFIFWMEYAHRMWGRLLGLVFAVPAAVFAARRVIPRPLASRLGLLFFMGGTQGLVGWWMVRSGLQVRPAGRGGKGASVCVQGWRSRLVEWQLTGQGMLSVCVRGRRVRRVCAGSHHTVDWSGALRETAGARQPPLCAARVPLPPGGPPDQRLRHLCHPGVDHRQPLPARPPGGSCRRRSTAGRSAAQVGRGGGLTQGSGARG